MHNLALALQDAGAQVSGSDDEIHEPARGRLDRAGLLPAEMGWHPERIVPGLDAVILGMHAREDNPELIKALSLGIPVYSFPEFVHRHCQHKQRIVIAGSHGKTTVTSIIMHVLRGLGRQFDYLVGAQLEGFDRMVRLSSTAPCILIEGDEYQSSALDHRPKFAHYDPHILVLTGIAWDHVNVYPTEEEYLAQFANLLQNLTKAGMCVYNKDDKTVRELAHKYLVKDFHFPYPYTIAYNPVGQIGYRSKYTVKKIYKHKDGHTDIKLDGHRFGTSLFGKHNVSNIAAAYEVCKLLAVSPEEFAEQLASFRGAALRLQRIHQAGNLTVYRDFAHAPSKAHATVDAVAEAYKGYQLTAVLELHTYSSLNRQFIEQYQGTLKKATHKIVLVNQHALEQKKMPRLTEADVFRAFGDRSIVFVQNRQELAQAVHQALSPGLPSVLLLMSSGTLDGYRFEAQAVY
jgi:UDP-N-acetylmuramate: L-alanyl-gamma-D-glutamyl-meso-diaminopimelate ligase